MKLLVAFPEPLPLPKARGTQVAWMIDALCREGVDVLLAHEPSPDGHPLSPIGRPLPEQLKLAPTSRRWPLPGVRWRSVWWFVRRLRPKIAEFQPDAIFVRHIKLAYRLLRAYPALPLIYEAHEVFADSASSPRKRAQLQKEEAYVLQHAAGVVSISHAVQQALHRAYTFTTQETVLHSGVDLQPPPEQAKDWSDSRRHVVYAGSFYAWKGVRELVEAAAHLPGYRITLIGGDASEIEALKRHVVPGGGEVALLPRIEASAVKAHLDAACIAVLPNRADGVSQFTSPLKLFEYMGAGCALVVADLPSVREVLGDKDAAWFTPGDSASLARALRQLGDDPQHAANLGATAARLACRYTWQGRARLLCRFITELAGD